MLRPGKRFMLLGILLLAMLSSVVVYATTMCHTYNDGCTICDFYGAHGEYQGYIEWCH